MVFFSYPLEHCTSYLLMFSARCPALIKKTYKTVTRTCTKCVDAIKIKGHFLLKFDFFTTQKWVGNEIAFHLPPELQQSNYRHPWERTMGKANCACTKLHPELQHRLQVTKERSFESSTMLGQTCRSSFRII